jgi:transposase InsO family protein
VNEKRALIEKHRGRLAFSRAALALGLSRKNRHEQETSQNGGDVAWKKRIESVLEEFPCYGYRRVTASLKRAGETVNKKKIMRIMEETGLKQKRRKYKPKTTDSRHKMRVFPNLVKTLVPSFPHHIWVGDITYVRLPGGFCYVAILLDLFTRKVVGYAVAMSMDASLVHRALEMALQEGTPGFHHTDRGGQYCEKEYVARLEKLNVKISMADTGISVDNPFAESFNRTLKVEEVYLRDYQNLEEAQQSIGDFIEKVYNAKRLHSSLGYMPPIEFEELWKSRRLQKSDELLSCIH